jgi:hypothetical protein
MRDAVSRAEFGNLSGRPGGRRRKPRAADTSRLERGTLPSVGWLATTGAALASYLAAPPVLAADRRLCPHRLVAAATSARLRSNALVFLAAPVISATLWFASTWVIREARSNGSVAAKNAWFIGSRAGRNAPVAGRALVWTPTLRSGVHLCRDRCGGSRQDLSHHCSGRLPRGSGHAG